MKKKIRICLEVQGLGQYEFDTPCPAGVCMMIGDDDAEELTGAEYEAFLQQVNVETVLRLACLDAQFTPADCRLISPEEYDLKYGEDD